MEVRTRATRLTSLQLVWFLGRKFAGWSSEMQAFDTELASVSVCQFSSILWCFSRRPAGKFLLTIYLQKMVKTWSVPVRLHTHWTPDTSAYPRKDKIKVHHWVCMFRVSHSEEIAHLTGGYSSKSDLCFRLVRARGWENKPGSLFHTLVAQTLLLVVPSLRS
jgi:hypothetical protein